MLRKFHTYPALISAVLIVFMAITGLVLSFEPLVAHFSTPASASATAPANVASLAAGVADNIANVQRIVRKPSGEIIAYSFGADGPVASYVDPATGANLGTYSPSAFFQFFTELHRSLFLGDNGRILTGLAALAMAILSVGGIFLTARRMGGFRHFFAKAKGRAVIVSGHTDATGSDEANMRLSQRRADAVAAVAAVAIAASLLMVVPAAAWQRPPTSSVMAQSRRDRARFIACPVVPEVRCRRTASRTGAAM